MRRSREKGGEGGKRGECACSAYVLHVGPGISNPSREQGENIAPAKGALVELAANRDATSATHAYQRSITAGVLNVVCAVSGRHTCIIEAEKATALGRKPTERAAPAAQRHQHAVRTASALGDSPSSRNPWPKLNTLGATAPAADGELLSP